MKKSRVATFIMIPIIFTVTVFLGYSIFVLAQTRCEDETWPIPPPASLEFGAYHLITDHGDLFIGQTYEHKNEGQWVGNMSLLFIDKKGATLLFNYPEGKGSNFKVRSCKAFIPRPIG